MNKPVLVTGGAGFIGSYLVQFLLAQTDHEVVVFDLLSDPTKNKSRLTYVRGDITSEADVEAVYKKYGPFATVYHLAAAMPNKSVPDDVLWRTNVAGTATVAACAHRFGTRSFVFTSSNVTYGIPETLPVSEATPVQPLEIYGKSKVAAEKALEAFIGKISVQIFRCPVVVGTGRLGLQAILFEFISENRNVYVLGDGSNRYQFADVADVCDALEKASHKEGFDRYTIGSDEVQSLVEMYQGVIRHAGSTSKIISIPKAPALFILSILDVLHMSPLGVYQYTMIWRSLYADTTHLRTTLNWRPQKTNLKSFIENYDWYTEHKGTFTTLGSAHASDNRSVPKMGVLKLLKLLS